MEIEDSPKSPKDSSTRELATDVFETTPEPKQSKEDLCPESTEKVKNARARRSLRFPKLWWDADGKICVGRKLRFAANLVKTTPQLDEDGWPEACFIGGRYLCKAIRAEEDDDVIDSPEMADEEMLEAFPKYGLEPAEFQDATMEERLAEDGYETLPMESQEATLMFPQKFGICFFGFTY